jgi:hypothetical protein
MKTNITNSIISKIIIITLLVGCLFKMPYGYYQFMRIAVCGLFILLAYMEYKKGVIITAVLCGLSVVLFNPIAKFYFNKRQWQSIDKGFVIALMIWIIIDLMLIIRIWKLNKTIDLANSLENEIPPTVTRKLELMRKLYNNPEMTQAEMLEKIELAKHLKASKQKLSNDKN